MTENYNPFPMMVEMTVKMVCEYLDRKHSIIIPLGVIEQHGYHLPLNTDAVIATEIAKLVGRRADVMVAPTVHTSFSGGGLPGTININPAVMSLVISDTIVSLAAQGFRNIYIFSCHGGSENMGALENSVKMLLRTNPACSNVMISILPHFKFGTKEHGRKQALKEGDWHAGWLETSLMMALAPQLVRMADLELDPPALLDLQISHPDNYQRAEKIVDDEFVIPRMTQRPDIRIGVMGHPEKASAELGWEIIEDSVTNLVAKITELDSKADGIYKEVEFNPPPLLLKR